MTGVSDNSALYVAEAAAVASHGPYITFFPSILECVLCSVNCVDSNTLCLLNIPPAASRLRFIPFPLFCYIAEPFHHT